MDTECDEKNSEEKTCQDIKANNRETSLEFRNLGIMEVSRDQYRCLDGGEWGLSINLEEIL